MAMASRFNRRNVVQLLGGGGLLGVAGVAPAAAQAVNVEVLGDEFLTARGFMTPETDPDFGRLVRAQLREERGEGALNEQQQDAIDQLTGASPARPEEVAQAFRFIMLDAPRDSHFAFADYFATEPELYVPPAGTRSPSQTTNDAGERYNAEWTTSDRANPVITAFFALTNTWAEHSPNGDETAWCAAFVSCALNVGRMESRFSALSGAYRNYGDDVTGQPQAGDIAVFRRYGEPGNNGHGHVAFFVDRDATAIRVLGGNQSNEVNYSNYLIQGPTLELHSIRRPRRMP